jgi:hypothetical protein
LGKTAFRTMSAAIISRDKLGSVQHLHLSAAASPNHSSTYKVVTMLLLVAYSLEPVQQLGMGQAAAALTIAITMCRNLSVAP